MNVGDCGTITAAKQVQKVRPCQCGATPAIRYAERHGERENDDGKLVDTWSYEAWVVCRCGSGTPRDNRCWSEEQFDWSGTVAKSRINRLIDAAVKGAIQVWNERRKEFQCTE